MKLKNILIFDLLCAQPVGDIKFHGGGEYVKTVFKYLIKNRDVRDNLILCYNTNSFIDDWILEIIQKNEIKVVSVLTSEEVLKQAVNFSEQNRVTIFCGLPYAYRKYSVPKDIKFVGVIHGLRDLEKFYDSKMLAYYRGFDFFKNLARILLTPYFQKKINTDIKKIINLCDVLIVDSNHTKYSLKVNVYGKPVKEPYVFYPETQFDRLNDCNNPPKDKYLMLISANRWLKNSYRTVMAIDALYTKGQLNGIKTYVFGGLPKQIRKKLKNSNQFVFFDYVSSAELEKAYKYCEVFLYPTLNEGFGNVPMEAMKYGKTCAISAVSSLTEVYRDTVYYFNPYDILEIQNRILQALDLKIDTTKIYERLNVLQERQKQDLNSLCDILLNYDRR